MLVQERYDRIIEGIEKDGNVKVQTLMKLFDVSIETIRRDLEYLENQGALKRVYGGAVLEKVSTNEVDFTVRETKHIEGKVEIGKLATRFVTEGQAIALDVSTTNTEVARALKKNFKRLTIITNSIVIAEELSDMELYNIILVGGVIKKEERCMVGNLAEKFIDQFNIDITFASCSGISLEHGITDYGIGEIEVKKHMMMRSQQIIVVADSSKFGMVSLLNVCDLDKISMVVTDSKLNEKAKLKFQEFGLEIVNI